MKIFRYSLAIIFLCASLAFAGEQIVGFEGKDLPVLNNELKRLENTIDESAVPTGAIVIWTTDEAPSGWVLCDGTAYNVTTESKYGALYDVIGNTFGGTNNTDFKVPDLRGRIPLGQDDMGGTSANRVTDTDADAIAGADGAESVTLTAAQSGLPAHGHTLAWGQETGGGTEYLGSEDGPQAAGATTAPSSVVANSAASAASAHTNLQPFITLNYIIKL